MPQPDGRGMPTGLAERTFPTAQGTSYQIPFTPIPAGLGWDTNTYPIYPTLGPPNALGITRGTLGTSASGAASYDPLTTSTYTTLNGLTPYYVNGTTGSNSNDGLTANTAFLTIWKAIQTINGNGALSGGKIYVAAGTYDKDKNFTIGVSTNIPTKPMLFIATGGRAIVGAHSDYTFTPYFCKTTITTGATSATQTVGSTVGMVAGQFFRAGSSVFGTISSITNSTTVVLTASVTTTTSSPVITGFPGVYVSSSNITTNTLASVYDMANLTANGLYTPMLPVNSIEECAATPNSYYYSGSTSPVYIHRMDGLVPNSSNTRVFRVVTNLSQSGLTQVSTFLVGQNPGDGFDLEGGAQLAATAGCVNISFSSDSSGTIFYAGPGTTFRYAGHNGIGLTTVSSGATSSTQTVASTTNMVAGQMLYFAGSGSFRTISSVTNSTTVVLTSSVTTTTGESVVAQDGANGVTINNVSGIVWFDSCDFSGNKSDGFNVHDVAGRGTYALTLNCTGNSNGRSGSISNNGWTIHETVKAIDIGGFYQYTFGGTCHIINSSKALLVGTVAAYGYGDVAMGGSFGPTNFRTSDTAEMWCYGTRSIGMSARTNAYATSNTSTMHLWNAVDSGGLQVAASGSTIDTYATNPSAWS